MNKKASFGKGASLKLNGIFSFYSSAKPAPLPKEAK